MRRALILLLLVGSLVTACGDDEGRDNGDSTTNPPAEETNDGFAAQDQYLIIDGGEAIAFQESCVDTSGTYKGQLPDGGFMILRIGNAPDESFVDLLPERGADPLSSQTAEDTQLTTHDDGATTGTSTVYTEDGANSLDLEFGIFIEDVEQGC